MLGFLVLCIVLGLWGPRGKPLGLLVAALAALLVVLFFISPSRM
jgi:hypothetical protein